MLLIKQKVGFDKYFLCINIFLVIKLYMWVIVEIL